MNRILHIAMKDLRHLYPGLAGCYGLIFIPCVLFTVAASGIAPSRLDPLAVKSYSLVCVWLYLILSSFVLVRLVQSDSLVGTTAFWLTRPISRSTLLAAKLFFVGLLLVLVPVTIEAVALLANGLSTQDLPQHLLGIVFRWLLFTLPLMTLASLSSDYGGFSVVLVTTVASWAVICMLSAIYLWEHMYLPYPVHMSRNMVWIVLTLSVSSATLAHQFLTRRLTRSLLLGLTGLIAITVCVNLWDVPGKLPQLPSVLNPGFAAVNASLTLTPVRDIGISGSRIEITGVPPGYVVRPLSIQRPASSDPSHEDPFRYRRSASAWVHNRSTQGASVLELILSELTLLNPPIQADRRFMMLVLPSTFSVGVEQDLGEQLGGRRETGNIEVVLLVSKLDIGAVISARQGASGSDKDLTKVFLLETSYWSEGADVALQQCRQKFSLTSPTWVEPTLWVLRNSKTKEAILGQEQPLAIFGDYGWAMFSPVAQTLSIQNVVVQFRLPSATRILDRDWLQDAELVRIRATPAGYLRKPITIKMGSS